MSDIKQLEEVSVDGKDYVVITFENGNTTYVETNDFYNWYNGGEFGDVGFSADLDHEAFFDALVARAMLPDRSKEITYDFDITTDSQFNVDETQALIAGAQINAAAGDEYLSTDVYPVNGEIPEQNKPLIEDAINSAITSVGSIDEVPENAVAAYEDGEFVGYILSSDLEQINNDYGTDATQAAAGALGYEFPESTEEVVDVAADTTADEEPTIGDVLSSIGDTLGDLVGNISIDLPTITPSPEDTIADILGPGVGVISPSGGVSPGTFDPGDWSVYVPGVPGLPSTSPNTIIGTVEEVAGQIEDAISNPGSVLSDIGDTIGDVVSDPAGAIESAVDAIGGSISVDDAGNVILGGAIVDAVMGGGSSGGSPIVSTVEEAASDVVGGLSLGGIEEDDTGVSVTIGDAGSFENEAEDVIGGVTEDTPLETLFSGGGGYKDFMKSTYQYIEPYKPVSLQPLITQPYNPNKGMLV